MSDSNSLTIESPCNKVCIVDPRVGQCIGCGRTLAEIGGWLGYTRDERTRIMSDLPRRLTLMGRPAPHPAR